MKVGSLFGKPFGTPHKIRYEIALYSAVFLNTLITVMNTSMFNVALPSIIEFFKVDVQLASLIVSSYSVAFAIGAILYSKLSDSFPIQWLILVGIIFLSIGSLMGINATSYQVLIVARTIQALGASSISALSIIITTRYIPFERRGKRFSITAMAVTLGFGLGPFLGGILTQFFGWEYLFGVSLIALAGLPFYFLALPLEKPEKKPIDISGMVIFVALIFSVIYSITYSILLAPISVVMVVVFYFHIRRHKSPFLQPDLLKNKRFIGITVVGFSMYFCNFSFLFLFPIMLVKHFDLSNAALIGLVLLPGALCASLVSVLAGRAVDKIGANKVVLIGTILMTLSIIVGGLFAKISIVSVILIFSISSSGFVSITTSLPNTLALNIPKNQLTMGIGTLQLFQFVGGAIGVSIIGKLITLFEKIVQGEYIFGYVIFALLPLSLGTIAINLMLLYRDKIDFMQAKENTELL